MQQEALVEKKFDLARRLFALYQTLMDEHICLENTLLLPAHATIRQPRWPTSLYQHEHDKILSLLQRALQQFDAAHHAGLSNRHRVILLLDYQRTLKNVLEHHEQREEQGLLDELAQHHNESALLLAQQCQQHWAHSFARQAVHIQDLRRQLDG